MKKEDAEPREITLQELIEVRKDEMQRIRPNFYTTVGDVVIKSKENKIREGRK